MIYLILAFLLFTTPAQATEIQMPQETIDLFRHSHVFPWRFYKEFGWFPDRDGAVMTANTYDWWITTPFDLTAGQKTAIQDFALIEANFEAPANWNRIVFAIDYDGMMTKINNYITNQSLNLTAIYIGNGAEQYIYFSRDLTNPEKIAIRDLIMTYLTYE